VPRHQCRLEFAPKGAAEPRSTAQGNFGVSESEFGPRADEKVRLREENYDGNAMRYVLRPRNAVLMSSDHGDRLPHLTK
jgi:hypothetical protein